MRKTKLVSGGTALLSALAMMVTPALATNAPPRCTTGQLRITWRPIVGGLGHDGGVIEFRNRAAGCRLGGYPGVDGLSANRSRTVSATRDRAGYLGGVRASGPVPTITIERGQTVGALLEWDTGPTGCPAAQYLRVTPPGDRRSVVLRLARRPLKTCEVEIHPVVPGMSGNLPAHR